MNQKTNTQLTPRPPIIVVMGHIDHGKTALLDFIRKTKVVEKAARGEPRPIVGREAGGITQHIGAYEIEIDTKENEKRKITFIDTPGHESFSKMRSRGAKVADIALLIIAADEGFKPQTKEALETIKNEKMPYIVVAAKIDKPNANPEMVKKQCGENDILIEEWGGKTPLVLTSVKTGQGIDELLELCLLIADIENFSADPSAFASGVIIESHLDARRGNAATLIIQNGALKRGLFIAAGNSIAPVKIFEDFLARPLETAAFSSPVLITGFDKPPLIGSNFQSFNSKQEAENYVKLASASDRKEPLRETEKIEEKILKPLLEIHIILKADTAGSLEAIKNEIVKLENEKIKIEILSEKVGNIGEEDIKLASSGENAIIAGFSAEIESGAVASLAERLGVTVRTFNIIYKLVDWLKEEIEKRLPPEIKEELLGKVKILKIFKKEAARQIMGGEVLSGKIIRGGYFRISKKVQEADSRLTESNDGKIIALEQNKIKTEEVKEGNQFGAMVETKKEIKEGALLEIFEQKIAAQKIY